MMHPSPSVTARCRLCVPHLNCHIFNGSLPAWLPQCVAVLGAGHLQQQAAIWPLGCQASRRCNPAARWQLHHLDCHCCAVPDGPAVNPHACTPAMSGGHMVLPCHQFTKVM